MEGGGSQASTTASNSGQGSRGGIGSAGLYKAQTRQSEAINDKEVKVEKALLDLNELKTQMFQETQNAAKELSPRVPPRKI